MNPYNTQIINLLNDGETFTDAHNCQILAFTEDALSRDPVLEVGEAIEEALDYDDYSYVATFEVVDGALTIHIHDESGVPVTINDERGRLG
jgi:hypothetical protein